MTTVRQYAWDEYYEKFYDWAECTRVRNLSGPTSLGSADEVGEIIIEPQVNVPAATRLLRKAVEAKLAFSGSDLVELTCINDKELETAAVRNSAERLTAEDMQCNAKVDEVHGYIAEFSEGNEQLGCMMLRILDDIEKNKTAFVGRNISAILANMNRNAMNTIVDVFVRKLFVERDAVMFAVQNNVNGMIPNTSVLKDSLRYAGYKESAEEPLTKFKARSQMIAELENMIQEDIMPLQMGVNY